MLMKRRDFFKFSALPAAFLLPSSLFAKTTAGKNAHIVVIGGGVGGATFAKYLRLYAPQVKVTVIEKNPVYQRPYGSSEVIVGNITMSDITIGYDTLRDKYGINFIIDEVTNVDFDQRSVHTAQGSKITYDRLVVSPGIDFDYSRVPGMEGSEAQAKIVHGWDAGQQLLTLQQQLQTVPENATVIVVPPPNPYRCPPGPYERSGLITQWLLNRGDKKAKVLILDSKDGFTTDFSMLQAWNRLYQFQLPKPFEKNYTPEQLATFQEFDKPGKIEWVMRSAGGTVQEVDVDNKVIKTAAGNFKADMINLIPPLKAGKIAQKLGLTDASGWCPVHQKTFESTLQPLVHVIGDASIAGEMPKSGYSANSQGKMVALQIKLLLEEQTLVEPVLQNTCYALAGNTDYGMFVADVFRFDENLNKLKRMPEARYLPFDAPAVQHRLAALYTHNWMKSFTEDIFG